MRRQRRDLLGPAIFVAVTFACTWGAAAVLDTAATSLLGASVVYAAVIGWQPLAGVWLAHRLVDDQRTLDRGRRPPAPPFSSLSIVAPLVLLAVAAFCALGLDDDRRFAIASLSWHDAIASTVAFCGVVSVLWLQAIAEEVAWRGYLLPRLMRRFGGWRGLVVHGVLWGTCYAPLFVVADVPARRVAGFMVTCSLLGVLLGWLRLASRSVYASAASNATLTICAGLPLALQGTSSPLAAVFEPIGWLPLIAAIVVIAARAPLRDMVVVPERRIPEHVN